MNHNNKSFWTPPQDSVQARALAFVRDNCIGNEFGQELCVTVNFHPDRRTSEGIPVLKSMAIDGVLKSQFETGTSNGGLSAFPGGARWMWEHKAFDGLYDQSEPSERPKYGALNHRFLSSGGSPRFGSAHMRFKPHIVDRTTFCYPDSYFSPTDFGTDTLVAHLIELADADNRDPLDNYIEAHIHGPISLDSDVEALVLDPAFKDTYVEALAYDLPLKIEWHQGFHLNIQIVEVNQDYRGQKIVNIARTLSEQGLLNPAVLGEAIEKQLFDPQDVKKVWHYLARFGDHNTIAEQSHAPDAYSAALRKHR